MDDLADAAGLAPAVLAPLIKTVGHRHPDPVCAQVCRDAGEGGIAAFLETAGAAMALFVALPLLPGGAGYGDRSAVAIRTHGRCRPLRSPASRISRIILPVNHRR